MPRRQAATSGRVRQKKPLWVIILSLSKKNGWTSMKQKKKGKKLMWERGYRCHTLWDGKTCVGRISLGESPEQHGTYLCETGTLKRETSSLTEAKRWVQETLLLNLIQGKLF
jgi:hypothetical protein